MKEMNKQVYSVILPPHYITSIWAYIANACCTDRVFSTPLSVILAGSNRITLELISIIACVCCS